MGLAAPVSIVLLNSALKGPADPIRPFGPPSPGGEGRLPHAEIRHFARKEKIADAALCDAIARAQRGLIDAALGGGLIKQRVARQGAGRSGGYRTLIAYRRGDVSMFIHGFAKKDVDNVGDDELANLRTYAAMIFALDERAIAAAVANREFQRVDCDA